MQIRHLKILLPLATASLALSLVHCGKVADTAAPASGTFGSVYSSIKTGCSDCHTPTGIGYGNVKLDFTTQTTAYSTLIAGSARSGGGGGACASVKIVAPGNITNSYLIGVLVQSAGINNFGGAPGCQPYAAHYHDTNLSDAEITSIKAWIQNGALNN